MTTLLLQEPLAPPTPIIEIAPVPSTLHTEQYRLLQRIRSVLDGWYTRGSVSISIDGVPAFGTADQCIEILERSRLSEIRRVHRLLTGNREEKAIVERKYPD